MITLGPTETDIGAAFRQPDAADAFSGGIPHGHPRIAQNRVGAGPDIARAVGPHAIGMAINAIDHAIGEIAEVHHLAVHHLTDMDAAADDVDALVIGREADAVA